MPALLALAIAIWSSLGAFPAIRLEFVEFAQSIGDTWTNPAAIAWAVPDGESCLITIWPEHFYIYAAPVQQAIITHEVGHCIGLNHIDGKGVMHWNPTMYAFSDADRAEFYRVHPLPVRARAAMVGN